MIAGLKAEFGVEFLAERLRVSVSGYYAWAGRSGLSARAAARWELNAQVLGLFVDSGGTAGHRKIQHVLAGRGTVVGRKTVHARMRDLHLVPKQTVRAWKRAAARKRFAPDPTDLVERNFSTVVAPGTVLVGDMTYVPTGEGWLYVATVIELASRAVIGWASSKRIDTGSVIHGVACRGCEFLSWKSASMHRRVRSNVSRGPR